MEREPTKMDPDVLAEIWQSAGHRRAEDMRGWLGLVSAARAAQRRRRRGDISRRASSASLNPLQHPRDLYRGYPRGRATRLYGSSKPR